MPSWQELQPTVLAILGLPSLETFKPFVVTGLALGGVYALSGVGMVVLYRATGVLNLAFGAIGAFGALVAWELINNHGWPEWPAYGVCVLIGGAITLLYGVLFGPPLAARDPLVKAVATLGLLLILLGAMSWIWSDKARSLILPTSEHHFQVGDIAVTWTQVIGFAFGVAVTAGTALFLRLTRLGTAMRGLANDREITATLGVPVRRVEAAAWLGSGLLAGTAGLLLSNLVGLDAVSLTFLVIPSLAAALIARLQSLVGTFLAALAVGLVSALLTPILSLTEYRGMTPFVLATIALLVLSRHRVVSFGGPAGLAGGRG
jgi:branched-chain amino acid transport system permease protein